MGRLVFFRHVLACVVFASLACASTVAAAGVINGDFEAGTGDTFDGWNTFTLAYDPATASVDSNRFALFSENAPALGIQLEQLITIPSGATTLSFDFLFESTGVPSGVSDQPDSFQASLLLPPDFLEGALPSGDPVFEPAFFSIDDGGLLKSNSAVSTSTSGTGLRTGWTRVSLNVSSLAPQDLLLEFVLFAGNDPNVISNASLDNVVLNVRDTNVVPEPTSFAILGMLFLLIAASKYFNRGQLLSLSIR